MSVRDYRDRIIKLLNKISDENTLKRIYSLVHNIFLRNI